MEQNSEIIIYTAPDGTTKLQVQLEDETVWLTQDQMAMLFGKGRTTITEHIGNIFKEGELNEKEVCRLFRHTTKHGAIEGKTQNKQVKFVDGRIKQDKNGLWWFRKMEGWIPADLNNPNNGQKEKALIVWRKFTGDLEQDNLMLDDWFQKNRISTRDFEFDTIYVNGSNNLPNLKLDDENWKVRLIEGEFIKRMWDVEGI